ncbi:E3 ubiquitin-protein ligase Siah1-like isoform X2 [Zootermopsis nevadensis]|uniref:E3 ubiquitin-protein ligase Siah1-like isoform X2 n=1 Tax=Zootermopsis nevadensis TaxID=136037 RepID=UPI000B8E9B67|nr:E3 ubiquitin-protein ligase Siah1-like isoform X2 [Zootermopsis nevadensis]
MPSSRRTMFPSNKLKIQKFAVKQLSASSSALADEKGDDLSSVMLKSLQCTDRFCHRYMYPPIKQCRMFPSNKLKIQKFAVKQLSASSSALADEKGDDLSSVMLKSLQCTDRFCHRYMYPPIKQCRSGHCFCFSCSESLHRLCPICGTQIIELRNRALEAIATKLLTTCKYRSEGCPEVMVRACDMIGHEKRCQFRLYKCFSAKCSWTGPAQNLVAHVERNHRERLFVGSEKVFKITKIENREDMDMMFLFSCGDEKFWVKLIYKKAATAFFGAVQYIGQTDMANNYKYCFEIKASGVTSERYFLCIRTTHADVMDFELIFESQDCFWAPINIAKYFAENDILIIKLNIEVVGHH